MKNYPVIKFTLLFVIGILLQNILPVKISLIYFFTGLWIFSLILFLAFRQSKIATLINSIILFIQIIFLGIIISQLHYSGNNFLPDNIYKEKDVCAYGNISDIELIKQQAVVFTLNCDSILMPGYGYKGRIKLLCRVKDNDYNLIKKLYNNIALGNYISIKGTYLKGRERRNPGEFDYDKYLKSIGITGTIVSYNVKDLSILNTSIDKFSNLIFGIRKKLDAQITKFHNSQTAPLLRGLLLADRSGIDYNIRIEFVNSGVIHVLAVSGLHVGYIILIFLLLFNRFNIYLRSLLTILGLLLFMFITGIPASVFRATVMAIIIIIALVSNRSTNLFNSISAAALIILLFNPEELFRPGFQLSFSAVLSIAIIYPVFQKKINSMQGVSKSLKFILLFAGVSLAAQLGTLPFTLIYFGKLSVVALFSNLIVIPLIGFIIGNAIFTLAVSFILPAIAVYYAAANNLMSLVLFFFVRKVGGFEHSFLWIRNFTLTDAFIFYAFLIIVLYFLIRFKNIFARLILILLSIANIVLFCSFDDKNLMPRNYLDVMMIDVGQGDSFLIKFPNGETAFIDAGNATATFDNGERIVLPLLNYLGINKINYGFVSHIDADHYGGFVSLIHNKKIIDIYKPEVDTSLIKDKKFEKYLKQNKIPISYYKKEIKKVGNVRLYFLNKNFDRMPVKLSGNDKSGLIKLVYGKTSFLFTGDLGSKIEKKYSVYYKSFIKSDVLKVSHHGSKTASSESFLNYVMPQVSLIIEGIKNSFNHPSPEVFQKFKNINSKIFRTDLDGGILLRSNGDSVYCVNWE